MLFSLSTFLQNLYLPSRQGRFFVFMETVMPFAAVDFFSTLRSPPRCSIRLGLVEPTYALTFRGLGIKIFDVSLRGRNSWG